MTATTGTLSIHTQNIFPIIKKFLYSDQEVFLRELVSNAVDATQKLRTLSGRGEATGELGDLTITIALDKEARTLTITDRGIGMTANEVEQYINQIAFSSAEEFVSKYQDTGNAIIGHFGLGFYSAFMVAKEVELFTLSYKEGAEAVRWSCDGSTTFTLEPTETHTDRGTRIVLHLADDANEFLEPHRIREVLTKYGKFLPVPVSFEGTVINPNEPLWLKHPTELTADDYTQFYQELYPFAEPPLFWIHLHVDYPFTLNGVLYFPKLKPGGDFQRNKIQLYSNRVFITDAVDDIVPDYLTLLHGVLESPDIPLNVSRSYLQTDANVRKISNHVAKKVADKLNELFNDNRTAYEEKWDSLGLFIKYGMLRDTTFYDRAQSFFLFKNTEDKYFTLQEYRNHIAPAQTDKNCKVVYLYATDTDAQHGYIEAARRKGYDVLVLDGMLDAHFVNYLEMRLDGGVMHRVDSDVLDKLIDKGVEKVSPLNETETEDLKKLYQEAAPIAITQYTTEVLDETDPPVALVRPEYLRRLKDMQHVGMGALSDFPDQLNLVINTAHPANKKLLLLSAGPEREAFIQRVFDLARLQQQLLSGKDLSDFIDRAYKAL